MNAAAVAEHLRALGIEALTEGLEPYGRDETMDLFAAPALVARPRSTAEVQEVLRVASREAIPVTPRGGGTGKAGGCIPVRGGIVLSLERMDRIKEIDGANRFVVVEPGVVLWTLHEECRKHGLLYPVDMSSGGTCELGGNVACDGGGERAVKYGTTRAHVTGCEAVLMGGAVIRTGVPAGIGTLSRTASISRPIRSCVTPCALVRATSASTACPGRMPSMSRAARNSADVAGGCGVGVGRSVVTGAVIRPICRSRVNED